MMNAKRYTGCRCCIDPDDVARRQIEKREWRKEVEEEITWVDGPNGKIPYNIQTEAGKKIWTEINLKGGSGYWGPLGRALPEVEAEAMRMAEERIIALLEKTDRLKTIEQGVLVNYAEEAINLIGENSER